MKFTMKVQNVRVLKTPYPETDLTRRNLGFVSIEDIPSWLRNYVTEEAVNESAVETLVDIIAGNPQNAHMYCPPIVIFASKAKFDNRKKTVELEFDPQNPHHGVILNGHVLEAALQCQGENLFPVPFVEVEILQGLSEKKLEGLLYYRRI